MGLVHFVGIAGSGVGALAQFHAMGGEQATGSDRSFDRGEALDIREKLEGLGIKIFPQNATALALKPEYVVASGSVEEDVADIQEALKAGLVVRHRADELAARASERKTIAVAGTSGKSTVAAMTFALFSAAGLDPSIITGGELLEIKERGCVGNAWRGKSEWLIIEADESDGTVVRYHPWLGALLNVSKDHKDVAELKEMFARFQAQSRRFVVAADVDLAEFRGRGLTFGMSGGEIYPENLELLADRSRFSLEGVSFIIPFPGAHNVFNALAALAIAREAGIALKTAAKALADFRGVARRFELIGEARGVFVVDDYAHNPAKVSAALAAASLRGQRILAVFQLHGFTPARFLKNEFIAAFARSLRPQDILWMPEIYYAGGTVARDISARDIADAVAFSGRQTRFVAQRERIPEIIANEACPGDVVLIMGARDPSLPAFARAVLSRLTTP